jgi:hypothetical protein
MNGELTGILESGRVLRQKTQDTPSETQLRLLVEQMPVPLDDRSMFAHHVELGFRFAPL